MNAEFDALLPAEQQAVREAIAKVRQIGVRWRIPTGAGDVYAYPHPGGGIAWGVNGGPYGFNIARGVDRSATLN